MSPSKSCELDPIPTFLLKEFLGDIVYFRIRVYYVSIRQTPPSTTHTTAATFISATAENNSNSIVLSDPCSGQPARV